MPADLNAMHDQTIMKCLDGRAKENADAINFVFQWLSICQRTLSLQELNALVQFRFKYQVLDIEAEVSNRCSRYVLLDKTFNSSLISSSATTRTSRRSK
jgi:hypothetical protein